MDGRTGCGACCIAPSISGPIPGMPHGVPCVQLADDHRCALFGDPRRPAVCRSLRLQPAMCGAHREQALASLGDLERRTA